MGAAKQASPLPTDVLGPIARLDPTLHAFRVVWRLEFCSMPPLTLTLSPEQIASGLFAGQTVVHVTTQCHRRKKYQQHLIQEYLIYRMYRVLTATSLGTRLLLVEYRDSEEGRSWKEHAFLVEDINLAGKRLGRRWIEGSSVEASALEPEAITLFALFQYMIGHTDWSVMSGLEQDRCCHNAALLEPRESDRGLVALPYDFDASGFVNTGDILPSEYLPTVSVRERVYRGLCIHNQHVEPATRVMNHHRTELEAVLGKGGLLTPKSRRSAQRYVARFYEIISHPGMLEARILSRCRRARDD